MPTPPTPNPNPALALVSMQNSMLPGNATAVGLGYLDTSGNVVIVSEDTPLPTAGGGGGGGDATAANQVLQITEAQATNTTLDSVVEVTTIVEEEEPTVEIPAVVVAGYDRREEKFNALPVYRTLLGESPSGDVQAVIVGGHDDGSNVLRPLPITLANGLYSSVNVNIAGTSNPVSVSPAAYSAVNFVNEFTGTTATDFGGGSYFIYVPSSETASLLILFGGSAIGVVSPTLFSYEVPPGGAYVMGRDFINLPWSAVLTAAGRAFITQFTD